MTTAALARYTGSIASVAAVVDVTGANTGTQLNLSSFDNANRVTRAVMVALGQLCFLAFLIFVAAVLFHLFA